MGIHRIAFRALDRISDWVRLCSMVLYAHRRHTSCIPNTKLYIINTRDCPESGVFVTDVRRIRHVCWICEKFISSRNLYTNVPAIKFSDILVQIFLFYCCWRPEGLFLQHNVIVNVWVQRHSFRGRNPSELLGHRKSLERRLCLCLVACISMYISPTEQLVVFRAIFKSICIQLSHFGW